VATPLVRDLKIITITDMDIGIEYARIESLRIVRPRDADFDPECFVHRTVETDMIISNYGRPPASWPTAIIFYC